MISGTNAVHFGLESASFSYTSSSPEVLHEISLECRPGEFIAVVGPVGCGKSSILKAILGEMHLISGKAEVNGSVAYCGSIDSWILNTTLRENIVIGREFNEQRYQQVLEACALTPDLQSLPAGDMTEIGERGINLSGGQKARVSLARGIYADTDIYLLDDPLGSVDAHVRKHIFQHCFLGLLQSKTRVLVTHSVEYLNQMDRVVSLADGSISTIGVPSEVSITLSEKEVTESVASVSSGRLVKDEERAHGEVKWAVYKEYFKYSGGNLFVFLVLASVFLWIFSRVGCDISLKNWGETGDQRYMIGFVTLSLSIVVWLATRTTLLSFAGIKAGNEVHSRALTAITRAPINLYFDVTPLGRLLNRLSKDVYDMDIDLPFNFGQVVTTYASFTGMLLVSVIYVPWILFVIPLLYWVAQKCQTLYLAGANNTNRMLRNANSPIIQHFAESIGGLKVIRSLNLQKMSIETNSDHIKLANKILFNNVATSIWLDLVLNLVTVVYFLCVTGFLILNYDNLSAGAVGLIIAYMLPLPRSINMNTQFTSRLKTNMISMERVLQLSG